MPGPQLHAADSPEDMLADALREGWMGGLGLVKPGHTHLIQSRAESWACLKTKTSRILWEMYVVL